MLDNFLKTNLRPQSNAAACYYPMILGEYNDIVMSAALSINILTGREMTDSTKMMPILPGRD